MAVNFKLDRLLGAWIETGERLDHHMCRTPDDDLEEEASEQAKAKRKKDGSTAVREDDCVSDLARDSVH